MTAVASNRKGGVGGGTHVEKLQHDQNKPNDHVSSALRIGCLKGIRGVISGEHNTYIGM